MVSLLSNFVLFKVFFLGGGGGRGALQFCLAVIQFLST